MSRATQPETDRHDTTLPTRTTRSSSGNVRKEHSIVSLPTTLPHSSTTPPDKTPADETTPAITTAETTTAGSRILGPLQLLAPQDSETGPGEFTLNSGVAQQCRQMVASIQLPRPLTMRNLIQSVAAQLGVRIRAHQQSLTDPEVSGLIAQKKSGLIIVSWPQDYEKTHPWWTALCVGHELGHLMCNHLARKAQYSRCQIGVSVADNADEAAAEYFGTLLAERIEAQETTTARRRVIDLRERDKLDRDGVAGNFTRLLRG
jgi:hypothetical protein